MSIRKPILKPITTATEYDPCPPHPVHEYMMAQDTDESHEPSENDVKVSPLSKQVRRAIRQKRLEEFNLEVDCVEETNNTTKVSFVKEETEYVFEGEEFYDDETTADCLMHGVKMNPPIEKQSRGKRTSIAFKLMRNFVKFIDTTHLNKDNAKIHEALKAIHGMISAGDYQKKEITECLQKAITERKDPKTLVRNLCKSYCLRQKLQDGMPVFIFPSAVAPQKLAIRVPCAMHDELVALNQAVKTAEEDLMII